MLLGSIATVFSAPMQPSLSLTQQLLLSERYGYYSIAFFESFFSTDLSTAVRLIATTCSQTTLSSSSISAQAHLIVGKAVT